MRFLAFLFICAFICTTTRAQDSSTPQNNSQQPPPKLDPAQPESGKLESQKESIIVTGVYEPIPLDEADRSVTVIPVDANQKILSNTVFDLLRLDPALDVQ